MPSICSALRLSKSTVYNYLNSSQDYAAHGFIRELEVELNKCRAIWDECGEGYVQLSDGAKWLAKLLRKHMVLPEELVAKAILEAHGRRLRSWRRKGSD